jgi:hypothetical protein
MGGFFSNIGFGGPSAAEKAALEKKKQAAAQAQVDRENSGQVIPPGPPTPTAIPVNQAPRSAVGDVSPQGVKGTMNAIEKRKKELSSIMGSN